MPIKPPRYRSANLPSRASSLEIADIIAEVRAMATEPSQRLILAVLIDRLGDYLQDTVNTNRHMAELARFNFICRCHQPLTLNVKRDSILKE